MNTHAIQSTSPVFSNRVDTNLFHLKTILETHYWSCPTEGVFNFQFLTGDSTIANTRGPMYFNLVRSTPTYQYESFDFSLQGYLTTDGTIVYSDGESGILINDQIFWQNGQVWNMVTHVPQARSDLLDLNDITRRAYIDSYAIGDVMQKNYYY